MNITVKVEATELADAINNLSTAIAKILAARAETRAEAAADTVITKAKTVKPTAPTAPAVPPVAAEGIETAVAAAPIDKAALQKIASAKSKLLGAEAVKAVIAQYGGKNINTTPDDKLAELQTALEALA